MSFISISAYLSSLAWTWSNIFSTIYSKVLDQTLWSINIYITMEESCPNWHEYFYSSEEVLMKVSKVP